MGTVLMLPWEGEEKGVGGPSKSMLGNWQRKITRENYNPILAKLPASIWSNWNSHILLLGMQNDIDALENSLAVS